MTSTVIKYRVLEQIQYHVCVSKENERDSGMEGGREGGDRLRQRHEQSRRHSLTLNIER